MRELARTLSAGLLLCLCLPLPAAWRIRPASHYWHLLLPTVAVSVWRDTIGAGDALQFYVGGLQTDALGALLLLGASLAMAQIAGIRVLGWSTAVHAASASLWFTLATTGIWTGLTTLGWDSARAVQSVQISLCAWWLLILLRLGASLYSGRAVWRLASAATMAAVLTLSPLLWLQPLRYWYPAYPTSADTEDSDDTLAAREVRGSAEALIYRQPALVAEALAKLAPGVPGHTDVYLLAFGGDGNEDVFRNEVEYAEHLFAERFGMRDRTLTLLNHPDTTDTRPLATFSNLKLALAGLAGKMDRHEDILVLFMTSHGTEDHQLYVDLQPLPLDWIQPEPLRAALDAVGIDWRVTIISACYSGGFVDALASPMTLVITAARPDRTSFGCGADSEITYFGRAFLVDALNQTRSLAAAFELARETVARREAEEDFPASEPQIQAGALILPRLQRWADALPPAAPLPFVPAVPQQSCERDDERCP